MNELLVTLIRLAAARGASDDEIARVIGYSANHIYNLRRAAGIASGFKPIDADDKRISLIVERLQAGASLQEIGDSIGVTRERVRQLAFKRGVTGKVSIAKRGEIRAKNMEIRKAEFSRKREERYMGTYGCSYLEVLALNEGLPLTHPDSRTLGYRYWVRNVLATMRSTGTLNFPQWCAVWGERWKERGRGTAYRLGRIDRKKPFTLENVICERGHESMSRHRKVSPWGNCVRP